MNFRLFQGLGALVLLCAGLTACANSSTLSVFTPSTTQALSPSGGSISLPKSGLVSGAKFTYPASSAPTGVNVTFTSIYYGSPAPQSVERSPLAASSQGTWTMSFTGSTATITFNGNITLAYSTKTTGLVLEFFQGSTLQGVCPSASSNGTVTFTCQGGSLNLGDTYDLEVVSGSSATPSPTPSP